MLSAVGTDAQGRKTSTSILVNVDQTAPLLSIESPQDQSLISRSKIDIRGTVNDAVEGLFQAPQPTLTVQVNGKAIEAATQVTDKQFLIKDLPLQTGPNRIVITASDMHGNQRSASILVLRNFIGSSRITLLSGDQQSGLIGEKLAQPLRVVALDENGSPLAKQAIHVDVIRGSGSISDSASQEHKANGLTLKIASSDLWMSQQNRRLLFLV